MTRSCLIALVLCSFAGLGRAQWVDLFNGRDLEGWRRVNGEAPFTVEDGAIVGTSVTGSPNSFLATERQFRDFVLEVDSSDF